MNFYIILTSQTDVIDSHLCTEASTILRSDLWDIIIKDRDAIMERAGKTNHEPVKWRQAANAQRV